MREDLRAALRDVLSPAARAHGFKGSAPTWRCSTPSGDWAIVNLQYSTSSSASSVRCTINTAVAPEPWLRWLRAGKGDAKPKAVRESDGMYQQRLHPAGTPDGTEEWWQIDSPRRVERAVDDMRAQLERSGWPVLLRLLDRDAMLAQVRQGDLGFSQKKYVPHMFATAEALLIMDEGPSEALDQQLAIARATSTPHQAESVEEFEKWVRGQAAAAG